ncbi:MAG: ribonuclease HII [Zetaproteobacteria bacterium]|nr:MAG: ribonuclease HII [Zetaproteobacteria bacterium]
MDPRAAAQTRRKPPQATASAHARGRCDVKREHGIEGIAGVDEVGRGPLAGPVVAAAVILRQDDPMLGCYRDSKKLSAKRRRALYHHLRRHALARAVAMATPEEIDRINILQASLLAMQRAVAALPIAPERVWIDGNHLPPLPIPAEAVVGGDARIQQIAAASILAKEVRDRLMQRLDRRHPGYGLAGHKGYPTRAHLEALQRLGVSPIHRTSFAPVRRLLQQGSAVAQPSVTP